jgi:hypothetical protein
VAEPSPNSPPLSFGFKTIAIRSPVQGITLSGPSEVPRRDSAEFIVKLTDKNGKTTPPIGIVESLSVRLTVRLSRTRSRFPGARIDKL